MLRRTVYHNSATTNIPDVPDTVGDMVLGAGVEAFALWSMHWRHDSADLHATQWHAHISQCSGQVDSAVVRGARRLVQRALWARAPHAPPAPVVLGGRDAPVKRAPAPRVHRVAELQECHLVERPAHQEVHVELCTARRMSCRLVLVLTATVARHTSSTRRFDTSPYRE